MRYFKRSITMTLALTALLLSTTYVTTRAFAEESRITATSRAEASHELTPDERRAASLAAGRILRHAYLARQAVADEDSKAAASEVEQGLKLVRIIERVEPKYNVTAEIKAGDLTYSSKEVVAPPLIPIYDELGEVELVGPLAAAKKEQQTANDEIVEDVSVEHTSLSLNLAFAKAGLNLAKKAIDEEDLTEADRALTVVQRSTVFEVDTVDIPLLTARENLYLAKTRVVNGDVDGAREALDAASEALYGYSRGASETRAAEVAALRSEIARLSADLGSGNTSDLASTDIENRMLSYWDRVVQWWEE